MQAWYWYLMAEKGIYIYDWPRPMVTVDAVVFSLSGGKTQVLLVNRGREPYKGKWAVPEGRFQSLLQVSRPRGRTIFAPVTTPRKRSGSTLRNCPKIWPSTTMK